MFDKGKDKEGVKNYTRNLILNLVEGLENSGRMIYMDSWYSSPDLFEELLKKGILATGIVQPTRKNLPDKSYFEQINNSATTQHLNLITITEKKKKLNFLSSFYDDEKIEIVKKITPHKSF